MTMIEIYLVAFTITNIILTTAINVYFKTSGRHETQKRNQLLEQQNKTLRDQVEEMKRHNTDLKQHYDNQFKGQDELNGYLKKQIQAQQEIIGIMNSQLSILEKGLKEMKGKKEIGEWEKNYKQQELALKQKKEDWKQLRDLANFLKLLK